MEKSGVHEFFLAIRHRILLIIFITIAFITITGLLSFYVIKPVYEAEATLVVQTDNTNNQIGYNDLMASQKLVKTYGEIIKSRYICEKVINQVQLNINVKELLKKVEVRAAEDSLITTILIRDYEPNKAVNIANAFAESFSANLMYVMKVDNVTILDRAKISEELIPVRPRPYIYMSISCVLGVMVGVGIALLMDTLDKTIKNEEQIEKELDIPVLGVIADIGKISKDGEGNEGGLYESKEAASETSMS